MVDTRLLQFVMIHRIFKMLYSFVTILILFETFFNILLLLGQLSRQSYFSGARLLSQCEVNYMEETNFNNMYPSENLNDVVYVFFTKMIISSIQFDFYLEIIHEIHAHVHLIKRSGIVVSTDYGVKLSTNTTRELRVTVHRQHLGYFSEVVGKCSDLK